MTEIAQVEVTPELAREWLGLNSRNRGLNQRQVQFLAGEMAAGRWHDTTDTIKFGGNGNGEELLLDGQHRLWAIVRSQTTQKVWVARGVAAAAQNVMDTSMRRSPTHMLQLHGYANARNLAGAARLALAWSRGEITTADQRIEPYTISHTEMLEFVEANELLVASAQTSSSWAAPAGPSAIGFVRWALRCVDYEAADQYIEDLYVARTNGRGDPRSAVLRRLRTKFETHNPVPEAYVMLRGWQALRAGGQLDRIQLSSHVGPMAFPQAADLEAR